MVGGGEVDVIDTTGGGGPAHGKAEGSRLRDEVGNSAQGAVRT
jgi:hypothetical protein